MAECCCNGVFAGASLFSPHRFTIGPLLKEGENIITLVMTGSAANRYAGAASVGYGLAREEKG